MKFKRLLFWFLLLGTTTAWAQVTLKTVDFETAGSGYTATTIPASGVTRMFDRTNANPAPTFNGGGSISGITGFYWASEQVRRLTQVPPDPALDVAVNSFPVGLNYTNLQIQVSFADARATSTTVYSWEEDDFIKVQYRFDGSSTWITAGQLVGDRAGGFNGSSYTGQLRRDLDLSGASDDDISPANPALTTAMRAFTFDVAGAGTTMEVRVLYEQTGATEELAMDNIIVRGTASSNQAPVLASIETPALSYAEGAPATNITSTLTVTDGNDANLSSAQVRITTGFNTTEDELLFTTQNGISGSYNAATGILALTGAASPANYQDALRSVQYHNTDAANASAATRTVTFSVTDPAGASSTPVSRNITVTTALDPIAALPFVEPFETDGEGTRYASNSFVVNGGTQFLRTTDNPRSTAGSFPTTFSNIVGTGYWFGENTGLIDNPSVVKNGTLTTRQMSATGRSGVSFTLHAGASNTATTTWQTTEYFKLYYRTGGAGAWTAFASWRGTGTGGGGLGVLRQDTDPNAAPGAAAPTGPALTPALGTFTFPLPALDGQGIIEFQLVLVNLSSTNDLAFDQLEVTVLPTVTTAAASSLTVASAVLGGNVTSDGGATTARGVVYSSTNTNPAIAGAGVTQDANGTGLGTFSKTISGLTASTTYYVRAYATNTSGTSYGSVVNFTTPAPLNATAAVSNVACFGGSNGAINLTPSGGTGPYTFSWGGGITTEDRTGLTAGSYSVTITDATSASITRTYVVGQPTAVVGGTTVVTNVACFAGSNGAINLTPSGGTGPYTFSWGGGITTEDRTGLTAGSYSVTITDANSCTGTVNVTVGQPASALSATTSKTDVTTTGGSDGTATANTSGGTPGYTYSWNTSPSRTTAAITGLPAGTYTVTVTDANGCTTTAAATVGQPAALTLNTGAVSGSPFCAGSAISVSFTASVAPNSGNVYTAQLSSASGSFVNPASLGTLSSTASSGTISGTLPAGTPQGSGYRVRVVASAPTTTGTDNGTNLTVNNTAVPTGSASQSFGSGATVANLVATGTAVQWYAASTGGLPLASTTALVNGTTYYATQTANNCESQSRLAVTATVAAAPVTATVTTTAPASIASTSATLGGSVTADGGASVTERGVVYVTGNGTPTTANTKVVIGAGTGSFSQSVTGLSAGNPYTVRAYAINSAGTSYGSSQTFTTTTALAASISSQTNVSCFGGTNGAATATATGGVTPYTFSWNTSPVQTTATATGLAAGTYTVTVTDANSQTTTATATIAQPTSALASSVSSQTNVNCLGGSTGAATVGVSGGTPGYTYSWAPSGGTAATATGLAAGNYTVTITDANSCTKTQAVTISQPVSALSATASKTDATTNGGSDGTATANPSGGTPGYTYSWNTSPVQTTATATGLAAGTYIVTVTDANSCTTTAAATVGQPGPAPANLVISTGTAAAPITIAAGTYNSITVTSTGFGVLAGDVTVNSFVLVNGVLSDGCRIISGGGSFTLAAGGTLGICNPAGITSSGPTGAVQVTGTRSFSTLASYGYTGAAAVTGSGLPTTVASLAINTAGNVTLSNPVAVSAAVGVGGTGNLVLNGNNLTLLSSASGTALAVNSSTGIVSGNTATVQRYISSANTGPGYRHYSAPVSGSTVSDLATAGFTPEISQAAAYNSSATPGTVTPFPTVFAYDQSRVALSNSYTPFDRGFVVPSAATPQTDLNLAVGRGYAVNIAGTQFVDFTGTLNTGPRTLTLARNAPGTANEAEAGWHLVGNPYPAPLDYSLVAPADRANLEASMYVYESAGQYTGTYRSFVNGLPAANRFVAAAQGFFVRVLAGQTSGALTFQNSQRVTDPAGQVPFRRDAPDLRPLVQLDLRGASGAADALYAYAQSGATPAFDPAFDARKLPNPTGLNLASVGSTGEALAIDGRPVFAAATALALSVGVPAAGTYTLAAATLANLPAGLDAFLTDAQTGQTLNLRTQAAYSFTVTAAQASASITGRFTLHFGARTALANAQALTAAAVSVFPNPAQGHFTVLVPAVPGATQLHAELLNALGQVMRTQSLPLAGSGAALTVQTLGLATGVYTLRLRAGAAAVTKRVVLE